MEDLVGESESAEHSVLPSSHLGDTTLARFEDGLAGEVLTAIVLGECPRGLRCDLSWFELAQSA